MVKNPSASTGDAGDSGLILGSGRFPGEGHGKPLHYSCLGNLMGGGAWQAIVYGVPKSQTWLSERTCMNIRVLVSFKGNYKC